MASPRGETETVVESAAKEEAATEAVQLDIDAPARPKRAEAIVRRAEEGMKQWGEALERPLVGASVAGGLIAAAAGAWGPTEAVLGAAVGLLVYHRLRRRRERRIIARAEAPHETHESTMPSSIH